MSLIGRGGSRRLVLVCPEPYCEYTWAPTRAELARMTRGEPGPDGITRAAG